MKPILIFLAIVSTSLFYFPFEFTFLPGINTKLIFAAFGLIMMAYHMISMRGLLLSKEVAIASCIAIVFSLAGYFSTDYNNTSDYAYSTYIISMWIWFSASYLVCGIIGYVHGYLNSGLLINYLIAVCVLQCILSIIIEFSPPVKLFVDQYFSIGITEFLNDVNRLYGIGASLDVAGVRFSVVLIMIAVLIAQDKQVKNSKILLLLYSLSFFLIAVIGNIMSRSTSVGMIIGILYLALSTGLFRFKIKILNINIWLVLIGVFVFLFGITAYFYYTNKDVYDLLRFGFEGFFNYLETGTWETDSTDRLQTMWVYPESFKTWIIGDGYFEDPSDSTKFYMGTDVGYLRFIFYSGLIGLSIFSLYFIYIAGALTIIFKEFKHLFLILLLLGFINWLKVSTDIFLVFALFLSAGSPYFVKNYLQQEAS